MFTDKPIWMKKRFWINLLAFAGLLVVGQFGLMTDAQWATLSGSGLALLNVLLSAFSGEQMIDDTQQGAQG
jgi:hypothetical protein